MPSLVTYRRAIAAELGPFVVGTTTTGSSDLVSFTAATLASGNACGGQFHGCWVYLTASTGAHLAAQRQVLNAGGYDPDSGCVTVARSWSTTVASGVGFEILSRLPAITDELGKRGIREIVNDVLLAMPPIDMLPVTAVTAQSSYDVTALYPWLTEKQSILGIYFQDTADEYPRPTGISWEWLYDADSPRLILPGEPFTTGQTFYIKARRPAQSWIKTSGTWAADTDGLQNDSDEALPLVQVVRAQALSSCYRVLGGSDGPDVYRDHFREREKFWTQKAFGLRWWMDQEAEEDTMPQFRMVNWGGHGGRRSYS